jgi:hypothetical protein
MVHIAQHQAACTASADATHYYLTLLCYCCCFVVVRLQPANRRKALGLADHVKLLPESNADAHAAQLVLFQHSGSKFQQKHQDKRQKIMIESIFGSAAVGGAAAAAGAGLPPGRRRAAVGEAGAAASAKEQLQQRVLACKKKKQAQRA